MRAQLKPGRVFGRGDIVEMVEAKVSTHTNRKFQHWRICGGDLEEKREKEKTLDSLDIRFTTNTFKYSYSERENLYPFLR